MVRLLRVVPAGSAEVLVKLEQLGPNGCAQDRVALALLEGAPPKAPVVEASSGNTGIALAMVCAMRAHPLTVVMPEHVSLERRQLLSAYGAKVELTPAQEGMRGAIERARALAAQTGAYFPNQFESLAAVDVHQATTAQELLATIRADGGRIDAFVCGAGTGALLTAVGRALKAAFPGVRVVRVLPEATGEPHRLLGIDAHLDLPLIDRAVVDETLKVSDREAWQMKLRLGKEEGLLVGISTGAHLVAASVLAQRLGVGKRVYTLACDTGERYFSLAEQFS
ncbi:MAG: PLP-dependent cysteine synthase family protein [Myxococcota bacterium]